MASLPLAAQLLIYPITDPASTHPSQEENGEGYFLTNADMQWFEQAYAGAPFFERWRDPIREAYAAVNEVRAQGPA